MSPELPETEQQWQIAVDIAEFLIYLDSARRYGLVTGGPEADLRRCNEIVREGARRGFKPAIDAITEGRRMTKTEARAVDRLIEWIISGKDER